VTVAVSRIGQLQARVEADGMDQLAHFGLGGVYLAAGKYMMAVAEYRRAIEINPEYAAAWKGLGEAYHLMDIDKEAAAAWRNGVQAAGKTGEKRAGTEMQTLLATLTPAN
jgi:tetratricopeptide (TPR) repeat protein